MRTTISRAAPAFAVQHFVFFAGILRIFDFDFVQIAADFHAEIGRADVVFGNFSVFQFGNAGFAGQRDFIQTAFAAHDQNTCLEPSCCNTRERMPHKSMWNTPKSWFAAPAGLVSGPKILKMLRKPRRTADRGNIAHGAVMVGREHKADAGLLNALGNLFRVEIEVGAHLFHDIGGTAG